MIVCPSGNLYGRGASDNKAPVLAWIHAVEAYQALSMVRETSQTTGLTVSDKNTFVWADGAEVLWPWPQGRLEHLFANQFCFENTRNRNNGNEKEHLRQGGPCVNSSLFGKVF